MKQLEYVKNSILRQLIACLKGSLSCPVYQFVPFGQAAPFLVVNFAAQQWCNDLPDEFFQAILSVQIDFLAAEEGVKPLHEQLADLQTALEEFQLSEQGICGLEVLSSQVMNQTNSRQQGLRKGQLLCQVKWRGALRKNDA